MNLVTRFLAARRDKLLMRLGCWLVCFSLVLGLMLPQQKAEALVAELSMTAVAGVAASYLCACGLPLVTQGMDRDALVSNVQRLIQEFLDTELGGITIQEWLGNVWDLTVMAGKLLLGRPLTEEFVSFAQWVAGKYAAQAGEGVVYSEYGFPLSDGSIFKFSAVEGNSGIGYVLRSLGTTLSTPLAVPIVFSNGSSFSMKLVNGLDNFLFISKEGESLCTFPCDSTVWTFARVEEMPYPISLGWICGNEFHVSLRFRESFLSYFGADVGTALSIDRAPSMSYIPDGIAAEQGIALDVGAAATMDLDLVLQGVLDDVLAGELTSTMEVAGEAVVDPPAEDLPDVDGLGLHALGQALTSRFPFSIPWDFFRAVQLLAAPAKAPYFEVDFMEPLADDVGGWQGDTTVVLDFSEYAIIGQISRWTSTIGFCLMLAGATKRLIWTA